MSDSSSGGIGVSGLLGVLFIGLKLGHVIDWPWLWVLAPFWIGFALVVAIVLVPLAVVAVVSVFDAMPGRRMRR